MQKHSPLGASGAERWLNCPGSVELIKKLTLPETDEEEYQREGTALHEATAKCLLEDLEAWEVAGPAENGVNIDTDMVLAISTVLKNVRPLMIRHAKLYVEHRISAPVHPDFYGTVDFGLNHGHTLWVRDFKYGKGIAVEVENNPQIMYYAYGLLQWHPETLNVSLGIIQPRAFHADGPVRTWEVSAEYIHNWVHDTLVPAMKRTETDPHLDAGDWCRFCPAKLVCPMLTGLFETAAHFDPRAIIRFDDISLGQNYKLVKAVKMYIKAVEDAAFNRLMGGHPVPGIKLVDKRANRVWKGDAKAKLLEKLGDEAMHPASLKSPAEIDALGRKDLTTQLAYTPESGPTVALESDNRPARKLPNPNEAFADAVAAMEARDAG